MDAKTKESILCQFNAYVEDFEYNPLTENDDYAKGGMDGLRFALLAMGYKVVRDSDGYGIDIKEA
jgi:hypothetical protein